MSFSTQAGRIALPLLLILLLHGCASLSGAQRDALRQTVPSEQARLPVPFFPQEEYQCGPASLAAVLNWSGAETNPEKLVPQLYLPARNGSLQVEMIATTRRHGRIPYVLKPALEEVLAEIASGHPVILLQNLAYSWYPRWHYAVAVGYDMRSEELILHTGLEANRRVPLAVVLKTWERAGKWAMIALPPDRLPASASESRFLSAVAGVEQTGHHAIARAAYERALQRWPGSLGARLGLGNTAYALGEVSAASRHFRAAAEEHPDAAAAWNNLAYVLAIQEQWAEAEEYAKRALDLGGPHGEASATLREIAQLRAKKTGRIAPPKE